MQNCKKSTKILEKQKQKTKMITKQVVVFFIKSKTKNENQKPKIKNECVTKRHLSQTFFIFYFCSIVFSINTRIAIRNINLNEIRIEMILFLPILCFHTNSVKIPICARSNPGPLSIRDMSSLKHPLFR